MAPALDGSGEGGRMQDDRRDRHDSKAVATSRAWLDEAIRTGRVVEETGDDPGAIIIVPCRDPRSTRRRGEQEPDERTAGGCTSGGTRPSRTPEQRRMLDGLAKVLGRTLTVQEENLALEQARQIGNL